MSNTSRRSSNPRVRNFMFTWNNPPANQGTIDQLFALVAPGKANYIAFQFENAPQTNTLHIQGYIELETAKYLSQVKRWIHTSAHLERRYGTQAEAIAYVRKQESRSTIPLAGPHQRGTPKRSAISEDLITSIKQGATIKEVAQEFSHQYLKHHKGIEALHAKHVEARNWPMEIHIYYGPTGTGKSWKASKEYPGAFYIMWPRGGRWWWDGYDGEETVIMDEFAHQIKYQEMLKVFDRYAYKIEYKGGMTQFRSKRIVITTNIDPIYWYPNVDDKSALHRRFRDYTTIWDFFPMSQPPEGQAITFANVVCHRRRGETRANFRTQVPSTPLPSQTVSQAIFNGPSILNIQDVNSDDEASEEEPEVPELCTQ